MSGVSYAEVVAGTLQDIVYLICTGTVQCQCQWPRLRGGGVEHVMIGVCPALLSTAQNTMEALRGDIEE